MGWLFTKTRKEPKKKPSISGWADSTGKERCATLSGCIGSSETPKLSGLLASLARGMEFLVWLPSYFSADKISDCLDFWKTFLRGPVPFFSALFVWVFFIEVKNHLNFGFLGETHQNIFWATATSSFSSMGFTISSRAPDRNAVMTSSTLGSSAMRTTGIDGNFFLKVSKKQKYWS